MTRVFHVATESREDKQRRLEGQKRHKADRQAKLERTRHKGAQNDVELANIFRQFGLNYLTQPKDELFRNVPLILEGRKYDHLKKDALDFLAENYNVQGLVLPDGSKILHFKMSKKGDPMKLYSTLAERSGQTRKVVKAVYEALVTELHIGLKTERLFRLPEIGRVKVSYRPAKEKRRGRNPFTGKEGWFKAKDASNKLRFAAAKVLKTYVENKVPVIAPPKKKKKGKKNKK